jgi:DNA-binding MarR family transcriptional regulator
MVPPTSTGGGNAEGRVTEPPSRLDEAGDAQKWLSGVALTAFRLNGQFLSVAEELARPAGLTAARWQVLGAVLVDPLPVAGVARAMGLSRQAVQRIADRLVDDGLAEYLPNPAHRRAKLVRPTAAGYAAVDRIDPAHAVLAGQLAGEMGSEQLAHALAAMGQLSEALDAVAARRRGEDPGFSP